jgi:deazaflavin-dependent oxidoreductase (nitroreductase family)
MSVVALAGRLHSSLYRATGGKVAGRMGKAPVLLLTTTGRRSGKRRTTPLLYLEDGGAYAVVASVGGAPRHPAWFHNLVANPAVDVEVGRARERRRARVTTDEEQARLWPLLTAMWPKYDDYQRKTERRIPVVLLEPAA